MHVLLPVAQFLVGVSDVSTEAVPCTPCFLKKLAMAHFSFVTSRIDSEFVTDSIAARTFEVG